MPNTDFCHFAAAPATDYIDSKPGCGRSNSGSIPGILQNIIHIVKISGRRADPPISGNKKRYKILQCSSRVNERFMLQILSCFLISLPFHNIFLLGCGMSQIVQYTCYVTFFKESLLMKFSRKYRFSIPYSRLKSIISTFSV